MASDVAAFLEALSKRKQALAAHLGEAERLEYRDSELPVMLAPGDEWLPAAMQRASNRELVDAAVAEVWGPGARWCLVQGASEMPAARLEPLPAPEQRALAAHPMVQTMLEIFGGKVEPLAQATTVSDAVPDREESEV